MPLTVRDLIRIPHLQLTLHAGAAGIGHTVTWAHTSDLPNPWEWLGPGELLLTNGLGLAADPRGQAEYLDHLVEAGTSALAVGTGMPGPPLTRAFTEHADRLQLPVLAVPYNVPFTAVARAVADANAQDESRQVARVARIYELLRTSVAAGRAGPDLFARLARDLGCRLFLVDPETGLSLFDDDGRTRYASALIAGFRRHNGAVPGFLRLREPGEEHPAVALAIPGEQPAVLVAEAIEGRLPSLVLLQHVATAGALGLAQIVAHLERRCRQETELFARLLDRRQDPTTGRRQLAAAGLDPTASVLVACRPPSYPDAATAGAVGGPAGAPRGPAAENGGPAGGNGGPGRGPDPAGADPAGGNLDGLHHRLARRRIPHLLLRRDGVLHLVLPDRPELFDVLRALLPPETATGVSDRIESVARIPDAGQEARWALGVAEAESRDLVRYSEQTALLLPRAPVEARALVTRVLGALITYDAEHGTDYLRTLRAMLRHNRSWRLAAQELHIHKQTLGYRLRKIEQLTGRGFTKTEHLAELWFAIRANDLVEGRGPPR